MKSSRQAYGIHIPPSTILTVKLQVLFPSFSCILYFNPPNSLCFNSFDALGDWPLSALFDLITDTVRGFFSLDLTFLTFCSSVGMHVSLAFLIHIPKLTLK